MGVNPLFEYEAENCIQLSPEEEERRMNAKWSDGTMSAEEVEQHLEELRSWHHMTDAEVIDRAKLGTLPQDADHHAWLILLGRGDLIPRPDGDQHRVESEQQRQEWPKYINVYEVTQSYGGPEEGGWWFDCGTPLESVRCDNQTQLDAATLVMEERYEVNDHDKWSHERKAGPHSCMRGAYGITICVQEQFAEAYPQSRPHYE